MSINFSIKSKLEKKLRKLLREKKTVKLSNFKQLLLKKTFLEKKKTKL